MKNSNLKKESIIVIIGVVVIATILLIKLLISIDFNNLFETTNRSGLNSYDKSYYISEYGGDLDSTLLIFPDNKEILTDATFESSFWSSMFDTSGYMILKAKYNEEIFNSEIERMKSLSLVIKDGCRKGATTYQTFVKYDESSYDYPAYITIDGVDYKYEYALLDKDNYEITYIYLAFPYENGDTVYTKYLKKDKKKYETDGDLSLYSLYGHSFDNGRSFMEFDDCKN